jgi:hypothetical protein
MKLLTAPGSLGFSGRETLARPFSINAFHGVSPD